VSSRNYYLFLVLLASASVFVSNSAGAQGFQINQYRPAELANDGFAISRPTDLGHLEFSGQLQLDYSLNPLVFESVLGDASSENAQVIEHMLVGHLVGAMGLWDRLVLYVGVPVNLLMTGDDVPGYPSADGTMIGDPTIGARVRLFGDSDDVFALALQAGMTLPLANVIDNAQTYGGDRTATFLPKILGELRFGRVRIPMNVGARIRGGTQLGELLVSHELTLGIGLIFPIVEDRLDGHVELYGTTGLERFFDRSTSPLEAIAGVKWRPAGGWRLGLAAGPGLTRGYGSPDMRAILSLGWAPHEEPAAEAPPAEDDDRDRDGIKNVDDSCPDEPEDFDQFQDDDGCPDIDNDRDRILDVNDECPNDPEDYDDFEDENGCPDPDNDQDTILDVVDECPNEPEDMDGLLDNDGCPEDDADGDTVLDVDDACKLTPGIANPNRRECNGCPALACMNEEDGTIIILDRVEFATNRDIILERSQAVLDAVYQILSTNRQIRKLRIEGHTDDRGNDAYNMDLSARRSNSVLRWLVEHGVEGDRLISEGFGETRPIEPNRGAEGRQTNRRVEFHIIDPAPGRGNTSTSIATPR
jgi:outer membrane protein OmpA-like peptidoglycan-associated protein